MTEAGGARFNNKIVRKLVWEKRVMIVDTARWVGRNSREDEIILFGSPTTDEVDVDEANDAKVDNLFKRGANTVSKRLRRGANTGSFGRVGRRRSLEKALATKTDNSIIAVKIIQVGEEESTIEVLVDTPKKHKKRKMNTKTDISENEKKETERLLPTLYDYRTLSQMQRCFQRWRPLALLDEKDGEAFGKMLMANTSKLFDVKERSEKSRREKLEWFFSDFQSMKELKRLHPRFESLMEAVIIVKGRGGEKSDIGDNVAKKNYDRFDLLTVDDSYTIGRNFLSQLSRAATVDGAYNSWAEKHPALTEFSNKHPFFRPLLLSIGKEMSDRATWTKLFLSLLAAAFSLFDGT